MTKQPRTWETAFLCDRQVRVEASGALAAADQVAVAIVTQPRDVGLRGDPRIHQHQGVARRLQGVNHRRQGGVFVDRAGKHLAAVYETRAVEHQSVARLAFVPAILYLSQIVWLLHIGPIFRGRSVPVHQTRRRQHSEMRQDSTPQDRQDSGVVCDLGTLIGWGASGPVHGEIPPGVRCCEIICPLPRGVALVGVGVESKWVQFKGRAGAGLGCMVGAVIRRLRPPYRGRPKCDALARLLGECRQMRSALHRPGALWPVRWFTSHRPCQALPYRPKRWGVLVRLLP